MRTDRSTRILDQPPFPNNNCLCTANLCLTKHLVPPELPCTTTPFVGTPLKLSLLSANRTHSLLLGLFTFVTGTLTFCALPTFRDYTDTPLFTRTPDLYCLTCTDSPRLLKHPSDTLLAPTLSHLTKTAGTLTSFIQTPNSLLTNYPTALH